MKTVPTWLCKFCGLKYVIVVQLRKLCMNCGREQ